MTVDQSTQKTNKPLPTAEKSKSFRSLVTVLMVLGIFVVLAGTINFLGALSSGLSSLRLAAVIFNLFYGVLLFICSRVLVKGKVLVIWLFSATVLSSIVYSFMMGWGFNIVTAIFGAVIIWQLYTLKQRGEIS